MPHVPVIKSSKKDVLRSRRNHARNVAAKSAMRTFIKKARTAIDSAAETPDVTSESVRLACKAIDKTAERGIIHRNQASRRKSRLMRQAHRAQQATAA